MFGIRKFLNGKINYIGGQKMAKKRKVIIWLLVFSWMTAFPILAQAQVKTLRLMLWSSPEKSVGEIIKKFESKNPNIRVVMDVVSFRELYDKATVTLMGKGEVDMVYGMAPWTISWATKGFLLNLDEYIPMLDKDDFYESSWKASLYQGSLYGIPYRVNDYAMIYNKDMFGKAGIDPNKPPKTWEEFLSYCKKLTNPPEQYGFGLLGAGPACVEVNILPFVWQNEGDVLNEDSTRARINDKPAVEAIQFWADLLIKHRVAPRGSVANSDEEVVALFSQRRVASMWVGQYVFDHIQSQAPELLADDLVGVTVLPKGKQMATAVLPWPAMIAANTKYPEESFDFVKFMTSTEMVVQYCRTLPAIKSAAKAERFNTPLLGPFSTMLQYSHPIPVIPQWPAIERDILEGCQNVLTGEEVQKEMDKVAAKINKTLTEK